MNGIFLVLAFNGNIKSLRNLSYIDINETGITQKGILVDYYHFNKEGEKIEIDSRKLDYNKGILFYYDNNANIIKKICYNSDSGFFTIKIFKYDINSNLIEEIYEDTEHQFITKKIFKYDINSNLIEEIYDTVDDSKFVKKYIFIYDDKNLLIEKKGLNLDNIIIQIITYEYSLNGLLIKMNLFGLNLNFSGNKLFNYDENNKITDEIYYKYDGRISKRLTFKYNEKDLLVEETEFNLDDNSLFKIMYKYNDKNLLIDKSVYIKINTQNYILDNVSIIKEKYVYLYDENDKLIGEYFYISSQSNIIPSNKYDKEGKLIESVETDPSYFKYTYKYDKHGRIIEKIGVSSNNPFNRFTSKSTWKYDQNGNNIEFSNYISGKLKRKRTRKFNNNGEIIKSNSFKYDSTGNIIKSKHNIKDLKIEKGRNKYDSGDINLKIYDQLENRRINVNSRFEYEYDKNNNWIKKLEFDENKLNISLFEREIEYYD